MLLKAPDPNSRLPSDGRACRVVRFKGCSEGASRSQVVIELITDKSVGKWLQV